MSASADCTANYATPDFIIRMMLPKIPSMLFLTVQEELGLHVSVLLILAFSARIICLSRSALSERCQEPVRRWVSLVHFPLCPSEQDTPAFMEY